METRKITIVSTKNQTKKVIMSSATTLAELKSDLRANGIGYEGMTFFEGISKVELKNDNSVLPHDVPYKGKVTNELVFMLTNTNKKIRSGAMSRAEAYAAVRANNLQEECVKRFGKNFTMCKTADLVSLVEEYGGNTTHEVEKPTPVSGVTESQKSEDTSEVADTKARAAISRLAEMLYDNDSIEWEEKEEILGILGGKVEIAPSEDHKSSPASPYSDDEIDDMFSGMNVD